ncbi:MAG: TRAP-type C4-dicarboxylate transport system substrate-binding protein [Arenicella sp.]|jgi:TRAP-type C4-dicarboxylate transport system substrate-binding protein
MTIKTIAVSILLLFSSLICVGPVSAATTLIFGEAGPNRGARAEAIRWFADTLSERSNGELRIRVLWGGVLYKANASAQSISNGVADLGSVIAIEFPQEMVAYGIADLPLDNPDAWVGMRATDELMRSSPEVTENLAEKNLTYIGTFTASAVHIGCKGEPIRSIADIKGKKIRGTGAYGKVFSQLGGNMIGMRFYEAYKGLDTGLIDCTQTYAYAVPALKQQEVIDSFTLLNWGQVGGLGILMNKTVFDSLDSELQNMLLDVGRSMVDEFGRLITNGNQRALQVMQQAGVEIIDFDKDGRLQLIEASQEHIDAWVRRATASGLNGEALLARYRQLIAKYTKLRDTHGYPWTE